MLMPSDLERVIKTSKALEAALADRFGAEGKGLHQKIDSVEADLPRDAIKHLRYVATIRNKIVHEDDYNKIDDRAQWNERSKLALNAVAGKKGPPLVLIGAAVLTLLTAALLVYALILRG